jgi:hypothetical protein
MPLSHCCSDPKPTGCPYGYLAEAGYHESVHPANTSCRTCFKDVEWQSVDVDSMRQNRPVSTSGYHPGTQFVAVVTSRLNRQ